MKYSKEKQTKNKGITLIALVITIIVLLILAGVSIAMLTGENGILTQATNAREKTTKAEEEEKIKMAVMGSSVNNNGYVDILDETSFKNELTNQFGSQELDVMANRDGSFIITIEDTQRKYYVNDDKTVINSDNIIEISTAEELANFRDDVNSGNSYEGKVILLTSDIILDLDIEWKPIGYYPNENSSPDAESNSPFKGIFDGCGNEINNIYINNSNKVQGFFGLVSSGTIKNLGIGENCNISTTKDATAALVGYLYNDSQIQCCYSKANVNVPASMIGGIAGQVYGNCSIERCFNAGTVTGDAHIGGIAGNLDNNSKIINCYNTGTITGNAIIESSSQTGGISGDVQNNSTVSNSYNIGNINGVRYIGGIVGFLRDTNGKIENCYYLENTVNNTNGNILPGTTVKTNNEIKNIYTLLGNAFKQDTNNKNNGYPILSWE